MSKVIFIRPGMTESGRDGRALGRLDEPLLLEERHRLSGRAGCGGYPSASRVYSAPSVRCRETATLIYPRLPAILVGGLAAFDCGDFEGMTRQEMNISPVFLRWAASPALPDCPGGENLNWYAARCLMAVRAIIEEMEDFQIDTAAIVTHGLAISLVAQRICLPRIGYQEKPVLWGGGMILSFNTAQFTATVTETV